jgi:hypothetical protein
MIAKGLFIQSIFTAFAASVWLNDVFLKTTYGK